MAAERDAEELRGKLSAANRQVEELKGVVVERMAAQFNLEQHGENVRLLAQVERMKEALRFYAKATNYESTGWQGDQDPASASVDNGQLARAALSQPPAEEKKP